MEPLYALFRSAKPLAPEVLDQIKTGDFSRCEEVDLASSQNADFVLLFYDDDDDDKVRYYTYPKPVTPPVSIDYAASGVDLTQEVGTVPLFGYFRTQKSISPDMLDLIKSGDFSRCEEVRAFQADFVFFGLVKQCYTGLFFTYPEAVTPPVLIDYASLRGGAD
jgi:hypothetical protein